MAVGFGVLHGSMPVLHAAARTPLRAVRGALLDSDERRAARRKRREEERERKRAERLNGVNLEAVADMNALYKAAMQAGRGVSWKASIQRYQKNVLTNIVKTRRDLLEGNDLHRGFIRFDIKERGKLRHISSVHIAERVPQKSLTQNALIPATVPTLIAANSANIKGRGTDYAIRLMKKHLSDHYRKHGSDGYIMQMDFRDYFARIAHGPLKRQIEKRLSDQRLIELERRVIDVQGEVGLGLGSEPNQICAVAFPNAIDHFVTELCGVEAYGRYMDDSYCIHQSKEHLRLVLACVEILCCDYGIELNRKKTRITKLTRGLTFLKKRFFYGDNGKVVVRPCRESITRERRKLKKQAALVAKGEMTFEQVNQSYQSWRGSMKRLNAHETVLHMDALFKQLFSNEYPPRS